MICKHLRKRQYNLRPYFYCASKDKEITLEKCYKCLKYEPRNYKPLKKISKKISVTSDTYNKVITRDNHKCRMYDAEKCKGRLELHHIVYRSEDKTKINVVNNCIMLCTYHHKLVHSNKKKYQDMLKEIISDGKMD